MIRTLGLVTLAIGAVAQQGDRPRTAMDHATFCGVVLTYRNDVPAHCDMRLMVQDRGGTTMAVSVTRPVRAQLRPRAEDFYGQEVCVSGSLVLKDREPYLDLADPAQIRVTAHHEVTPFGAGAVTECDDGVTAPKLLHEVKPMYTAEAMRAGVQGAIRMAIVVATDGTVTEVRRLDGIHPEMDAAAAETVRQWRFAPGRQNGSPVPVMVWVDMHFVIK